MGLYFVNVFLHILLIFTPVIAGEAGANSDVSLISSQAKPCVCKGKAEIPDFKEYNVEEEEGKTPLGESQLVISSAKAMILSNEPDSLITCVDDFTFPAEHENKKVEPGKCLVIKDVFSTEYFLNPKLDKVKKATMKKRWNKWVKGLSKVDMLNLVYRKIAKPMFFIEHELEIFQLWKPDDVHSPIVQLYSNAVRGQSVLLIMELGTPLPTFLEQMSKQWAEKGAEQINKDIEAMVKEFVETLDSFHEKALHLHLKPGNWVYVQRGTQKKEQLKLIDFQNSIKTDWEKDSSPNLEHLIEFACNSQWNENALVKATGAITASERPSTYASPEHAEACRKAKPKLRDPHTWRKDSRKKVYRQSLKQITTKSEVWSLGILIIEVLAQAPPILEMVTKISGERTKFLSKVGHKTEENQKKAEAFELLRAFFLSQEDKLHHVDQRTLAKEMGDKMASMFARIDHILRGMIFVSSEKRSTLEQIRDELNR